MTKTEAIVVLEKARDLVGHSYKTRIWRAWFSGKYAEEGLESLTEGLRTMRDTLGPTFLNRTRLTKKGVVA